MSNRTQALKIIRSLRKEGFEALFAGGCVRDHLLGRPAKDYDVVTNARPDQIIPLFRRTLKIGAKFGVVMVILDGGGLPGRSPSDACGVCHGQGRRLTTRFYDKRDVL